MIQKDVEGNLKEVLKKLELHRITQASRRELAQKAGMHYQTLQKCVARPDIMRINHLVRLCEALNLKLEIKVTDATSEAERSSEDS